MINIPKVKLGVVAVSRDCFPIDLSERRRAALMQALAARGVEAVEIQATVENELDAKKALNIRILKVEDLTTVTDYFVIATGTSTTHVGALADEADFILSQQGVNPLRTEGHDGTRWVLLDYGSVIVHVFTKEAHDYYDLEHLWADATELGSDEWMKPAE